MKSGANCVVHLNQFQQISLRVCRQRYKAEFVRFLVYAHSSCNETIEWIEYIIKDCYPDFDNSADEILSKLDLLGRKLNIFI